MLKNIKIKNFKTFCDFNLESLSQINIIGGYNNIGKTTLLEAISLYYKLGKTGEILDNLISRGINNIPITPETIWAPLFNNFNIDNIINIETNEQNYGKMTIEKINNFASSAIALVNPGTKQIVTEKNLLEQMKLNQTALSVKYFSNSNVNIASIIVTMSPQGINQIVEFSNIIEIPISFDRNIMQIDIFDIAERYGKLIKKNTNLKVVNALKIIDKRIKDIQIIPIGKTPVLHVDIGSHEKIPINFFGGGFVRLVNLLILLITSENGILLVDEIENGLHFSILQKLWETITIAAKDFNCQIIATTHSYECIENALKGVRDANYADNFRYVRLDENKNTVGAKIFEHEMLNVALQNNMEIR